MCNKIQIDKYNNLITALQRNNIELITYLYRKVKFTTNPTIEVDKYEENKLNNFIKNLSDKQYKELENKVDNIFVKKVHLIKQVIIKRT